MKNKLLSLTVLLTTLLCLTPNSTTASETTLGTAFTYQGRLQINGEPVTDNCGMAFRLYDASDGGNQVGNAITTTVSVNAGLFTASLDFGNDAFNGDGRWLGIRVKCGYDATYADLGRQALTAAPYALYARSTGALQGYPVTAASPALDQVLKWDGSAWVPDTDEIGVGGAGDITAVGAGTGLIGGGESGAVTLTLALPVPTATLAISATQVPWSGLTGIPAGFADGVDDVSAVVSGTSIFAGDGLTQMSSGDSVTIAVDFAGSGGDYGTASTVPRSDHGHDSRYYTQGQLNTSDGGGQVHWDNLTAVPTGLADGDDDTTYTAGAGLTLDGVVFSVVTATIQQRVADACGAGYAIREINADGSVTCEPVSGSAGGDITAVNAGTGLTGGGESGPVTLTVDFAGTGVADTAARSDHDHAGIYSPMGHTHDDRYYTETELEGDGTASVHWNNLTNRPAGLDDGDDDTTYSAGTGLALAGTEFRIALAYRLPQSCSNGQIAEWNGTAWNCGEDDVGGGGAWLLTGNAGTTPGTNFLGTTDEVSLTLAVNGTAALRLYPNGTSPNLVGGHSSNQAAGVVGATVGGGGTSDAPNQVTAGFGTVGGGSGNQASGNRATVGGGQDNTASGIVATVSGGWDNLADGMFTTVGGGWNNTAGQSRATVGGGASNTASGEGATVGGGAANVVTATFATVAGGEHISVTGDYAAVGGGQYNVVSGGYAIVGGGSGNQASGNRATVSGGWDNTADGIVATVSGGRDNVADGMFTTVSGGWNNSASRSRATVSGGASNTASGEGATVGGGAANVVTATFATVAGGEHISVTGAYAAVAGGSWITVTGDYAAVAGGQYNVASDDYATVGGGSNNAASGYDATVGGGNANSASDLYATVGGGQYNVASNDYATVGGGYANDASGDDATVGGGYGNTASGGAGATVGGGWYNDATADYATVGGGWDNYATGGYATVGGGWYNDANGYAATVGGGVANYATGRYATVPGGYDNDANGDYSFAAGRRAQANNQGCFVWGDSTDANVACNAVNRWVARASGGVYFYTNSGLTSGMYLSAGGSSWNAVSDRARKENFAPIDAQELLAHLAEIPITTWNYKSQDPAIRHIGPMAQDFNRLIDGLGGEGEDYINTLDAHGVALAAIQELYAQNQSQGAQIEALQQQNADLEARLAALEAASANSISAVQSGVLNFGNGGWMPELGVLLLGLGLAWGMRRAPRNGRAGGSEEGER